MVVMSCFLVIFGMYVCCEIGRCLDVYWGCCGVGWVYVCSSRVRFCGLVVWWCCWLR